MDKPTNEQLFEAYYMGWERKRKGLSRPDFPTNWGKEQREAAERGYKECELIKETERVQ